MLTTLSKPNTRLDKLLLFHFLLVTAWVILCAPLLAQSPAVEPLVLSSLVIVLTSVSTILGLKVSHNLGKTACTLLFVSWMAVWVAQLFSL
ncbi:hypothetical protein JK628_14330 [Shewanella sp. KX20019]|uniref:hypothetical protein n=1 Tax=Shewanella sp. KX20019 TaxID=2803864 RepID=UPI0019292D46|nr:hypothetical protein [Shewanella sp. KX20019]QQX78742.1 hypothetical protein JK628_14330 [Shewanella sp. KX20019]